MLNEVEVSEAITNAKEQPIEGNSVHVAVMLKLIRVNLRRIVAHMLSSMNDIIGQFKQYRTAQEM